MVAVTATWTDTKHSAWIRSPKWDLTFLILSSVLVLIPIALHYVFGASTDTVNLIVAGLVGGPHMYSTFTLTFWDPSYRRKHPVFFAFAFVIPVIVIYLAVVNLTLLITLFMMWASFHVLQQIGYLTDCYRAQAGEPFSGRSQAIDYAVLFTSLYPVALYRLVLNEFQINDQPIYQYFPAFLRNDVFFYLVTSVFAVALGLWLIKTYQEHRSGRLNLPKTLLIGITIPISFFIPLIGNLDVAFQGMNMWHSFQYLALLWYLNVLRRERNEISSKTIRGIAGTDKAWHFYGFHVAMTLVAGGVILALYALANGPLGWELSFAQAYTMVVLSWLLMHYYFDTGMFAGIGAVTPGTPALVPGLRAFF
jgi:hypothetical protein